MSDYSQKILLTPLCASLLAISMQSFAEENKTNSEATQLETIQAEANKSSTMKTATGLELKQKETPQSVSVITQEQIKDQGITSINDALKQATGINVIRESGHNRYQSRGFYINQIEEDGLSSSLPGGTDNVFVSSSSLSDIDIYEHIEIVRGATGLTQAYGEPGGTLNAVRKQPTKDFQMQGYLQAGRWNNMRSVFDVSGPLNHNQNVRGRFVAIGADSDSFKTDVSKDNRTFYGVLDVDLTPATLLRIGAMYQKSHSTLDSYGVPMLTNGSDSGLSRDTYLNANWAAANYEKYNVFGELEHKFNDDWNISAKVNSNWNKALLQLMVRPIGTGLSANGNFNSTQLQRYTNSSDELNVKLSLNGKYHLFNATHDLFANLNYISSYENSEMRRIAYSKTFNVWNFDSESILEPNWDNNIGHRYLERLYITQKAATLGTRINLLSDKAHILLAGRYAETESDYRIFYPITNTNSLTQIKKGKFTPYIGLSYDLTDNTSIYASQTEIFKPQSSRTSSGVLLEPLVGKNNEVGIKSELFDNRLNASLAWFKIEHENRAAPDPANSLYSISQGKVTSQGIELEISGRVTDDLALFAGYTYNKSKYLHTESSLRTAGSTFSKHTPEHMFKMYSQYQLPGALEKWSMGVGFTAQTDTSSLYNIYQGGYTLWNANIRYTYSPNLSFNLIGENITDKRYYENNRVRIVGGNNYLGSPANVLFRVDWKY